MSDIFNRSGYVYADIDADTKKLFDSFPKPKNTGKDVVAVPMPVRIGYHLSDDGILNTKIDIQKFDLKQNKYLRLEGIYSRKLVKEELDILANYKSKQGMQYLIDFTGNAWEKMDELYEGHVADTVFTGSKFVSMDNDIIIQTINNLKKL